MSSTPEEKPGKNAAESTGGSRHALVAIGAATVALVVVLSLALRGGANGHFAGEEEVSSVVRLAHKLDEANFEAVNSTAGNMGDWLLTKGFDGYSVPDGLAGVAVGGCALAKNDVTPVAVLLLDAGGRRAAVFPAGSSDLDLPEDGSWHVYDLPAGHGLPRLAVAASFGKGVCFVVSGRESPAQLGEWLQNAKIPAR